MVVTQADCIDRLWYYGSKCDQHLSRIRLSHLLALRAVRVEALGLDSELEQVVRDSFESSEPDVLAKLRRGLHEVHLVALKADFELYLNRVLTVVWTADFDSLVTKVSGKHDVSLRDIAEAALEGVSGRDFVTAKVVPSHGLGALGDALKLATGIDLRGIVANHNLAHWSQIQVGFEVRHLIEHCDGKIDTDFRKAVEGFWATQPGAVVLPCLTPWTTSLLRSAI
jgi:hypothetical protein